jgi:hypothetical protein
MPIKRDSIFNGLIESCDSYAAVPRVTVPSNYYGQIRHIRQQAADSEPNDSVTLDRLTGELQILARGLSIEQRHFFDDHHNDAQAKKIGGR